MGQEKEAIFPFLTVQSLKTGLETVFDKEKGSAGQEINLVGSWRCFYQKGDEKADIGNKTIYVM